jgi:hypothetical protein
MTIRVNRPIVHSITSSNSTPRKRARNNSFPVLLSLLLFAGAGLSITNVDVARTSITTIQSKTDDAEQAEENAEEPGLAICATSERKPNWILFAGDSNMRHTYFWFTKTILAGAEMQVGSTFGLDRVELGFGGRWGDQEAILKHPNSPPLPVIPRIQTDGTNWTEIPPPRVPFDTYLRSSFRFLHGAIDQLVGDASDWNAARKVVGVPYNSRKEQNVSDQRDFDGDGSIRPSDYAIWATKNTELINETANTAFTSSLASWEGQHPNGRTKKAPDIVILTQGWGGIPTSDHFDIVRTIVRSNPSTFFLWAPLYVTSRQPSRHAAMQPAFGWSEPNLKVVDLWDLILDMLPAHSNTALYHAPTGGKYMKEAFLHRMWSQIACKNNETKST